jgi:tetratricopeptide (TPR) repeat protein
MHRPNKISLTAKDREALPVRKLASRQQLLKSIAQLAPRWQPWKMNAAERQAWYRVGDESFDHICTNSREWCLVGRKFENRKQFEEAAQSYCRSIRLNPHCSSYYFRLGCVQCELGEWNGAIESFHCAITLAPEYVRATYFFNLGYAHSELRSWNEAVDALKQAVALKPKKHAFHNLIAVCYRHANEYDLSIHHYKKAISLDRIQPAYRRNLAYVYMQLKQWGKAVRAWSGAIEVSSAKHHPELYRNRAFAQAERGYLAVACEDMSHAYSLYTSSQQRKRCREKLERWTARLQGTEQAYLRAQQKLLMSQAQRRRETEDDADGAPHGNQRRRKIRQLAGLIQGEWEEWPGEDVDDGDPPDEETDPQDIHPSRRKRLDMTKQSRRAPSSSLLIKGYHHTPSDDEKHFHASSSSAYIANLIVQVGLDRPYVERFAEEEMERKEYLRREKLLARAERKEGKHERKRGRIEQMQAALKKAREEGESVEDVEDEWREAIKTSSEEEEEEDEDEDDEEGEEDDPDGDHLAQSDDGGSPIDTATSLAADEDGVEDNLYAEDHLDPYSSLSKLFIRLRIDSKYLWRFEQAKIHLNNIHLVTESDMRRVLPPLGPRLTLMNYLQDRIAKLRSLQGLPPLSLDDPNNSSGDGAHSGMLELTKTHGEWQRLKGQGKGGGKRPKGLVDSTPEEAAKITSTFSPRRSRSPNKRGQEESASPQRLAAAGRSPSPRREVTLSSPPRQMINPSPIIPASPHNSVTVQRPLSARDRRQLYDSLTNMRSGLSPIRTIGSVSWRG